jgi:thiol:disulfide interchange protein DsbD
VLSLSMFGVYELQLPTTMTSPLANASHRLPGGTFGGVFAMGGVSALIVSPCVAAPLAGALLFISRTHDVWLGATGLFALSIGMGIPLLAVGASAGALLPRAGAWMETVKRVSGVVLLGVAIYIVQPVIPATLALLMWGLLLVGTAVMLVTTVGPPHAGAGTWARRFAAAVTGLIGAIQIVGATSGGTDPLHPLSHLRAPAGGALAASPGTANGTVPSSTASATVVFQPVRSVADLDAALAQAKQLGRPAMLDFYADWCVSCKEMEHLTFSETPVQSKLAHAVLLKADVTKNTADDRELLKRFQLFGPPGTIFFDAQGKELVQPRVIGFQNTERFLETLRAVGL